MAKIKLHLVELTDAEIMTLLESLVFSSTTDVCANWEEEDNEKMLELALRIKKYTPKAKMSKKRLNISKGMVYEDKNRVKTIKKEFNI